MTDRSYHGDVSPGDMAGALIAAFNQGNMRCQQVGQGDKVMVQIAAREQAQSGGQGALSVTISATPTGLRWVSANSNGWAWPPRWAKLRWRH